MAARSLVCSAPGSRNSAPTFKVLDNSWTNGTANFYSPAVVAGTTSPPSDLSGYNASGGIVSASYLTLANSGGCR